MHQLAYLDSVPVEAATAVQAGEARGGAPLQMLRNLWLQVHVQASLVGDLMVVVAVEKIRSWGYLLNSVSAVITNKPHHDGMTVSQISNQLQPSIGGLATDNVRLQLDPGGSDMLRHQLKI